MARTCLVQLPVGQQGVSLCLCGFPPGALCSPTYIKNVYFRLILLSLPWTKALARIWSWSPGTVQRLPAAPAFLPKVGSYVTNKDSFENPPIAGCPGVCFANLLIFYIAFLFFVCCCWAEMCFLLLNHFRLSDCVRAAVNIWTWHHAVRCQQEHKKYLKQMKWSQTAGLLQHFAFLQLWRFWRFWKWQHVVWTYMARHYELQHL